MNSLLDKELEHHRLNTGGSEKENRDLNRSRELTTKDFNNSFELSGQKEKSYKNRAPLDISQRQSNFFKQEDPRSTGETSNKSLKM